MSVVTAQLPRRARIATGAAFAMQGFFLLTLLTSLPQLKPRFGLSDTGIALIALQMAAVGALGSLLAEQLATRLDSRRTVMAGLGLIAVSGMLLSVVPDKLWLHAAMVVYGIALGLVDASANMQAVAIQHRYGTIIMNSFHGAWSIGALLGAVAVAALTSLKVPVNLTLVVVAAVVALVALVSTPHLLRYGHEQAVSMDLGEVSYSRRAFIFLCLAMAAFFAMDLGLSNWSPLYLTERLGATEDVAPLGAAAYLTAGLAARVTGDLWVRRFGEVLVVRAVTVVGIIGAAIVVLAPNPGVAIAGCVVIGLGVPLIAPLSYSTAGWIVPMDRLDAMLARLNLFNYLGTLVGGAVLGLVAAATGLRVTMAALGVLALAIFLMAPAFRRPPAATSVTD